MIRSIEIDGMTFTADPWIDAGLPECLYCCLDGTRGVYRNPFNVFGVERDTLERLFSYANITKTLNTLLGEFRSSCDERDGEFLTQFATCLGWALNSRNPLFGLSFADAEEFKKKAADAVKTLKTVMQRCDQTSVTLLVHVAVTRKREDHADSDVDTELWWQTMSLDRALKDAHIDLRLENLLDCWLKDGVQRWSVDSGVRPGSGDLVRRSFCVAMARYLEGWLGSPMIPQVAALSSALFAATTDDYVRKAYERYQT